MTILQFAKEHCANYTAQGGCAGIGIHNDGRLYGIGPKPKCLLASDTRCDYFEQCVFGTRIEPNNARNVVRNEEIEQAKWAYRQITGYMPKKRRAKTGPEAPDTADLPPSCPATDQND